MELNNKRILVTGADGFIGSHLVEAILNKGVREITALSLYNSFNYWGWLEDIDLGNRVSVVTGDIRDPFFVRELCKDVDVVFHLAALIGIPYSYTSPYSYIETNITGTLNICYAARDLGCEKLIHTSTSEVYGSAQSIPINEEHPLQAQSPYSASKIGADSIAKSFFHSFDLPLTIARPFNAYGPRQSARAVIPTIITQIMMGNKKIKLGKLTPTRDFNYVIDVCRALIMIAESDKTTGETINIGSNQEISIKETADLIKELMKSDVDIEEQAERIRPQKSEVDRLCCDNSKIKELCGYEPEYNIRQGLTETILWFSDKKNRLKYKSNIYNI